MIDLHNHILPGIDDGATDVATAVAMAKAFVADGVQVVACTPHILPGLYHNSGPQIRSAIKDLQAVLDAENIDLQLVPGADNHITPDFVEGLRSGHLLSLADSRYVLVEPPHHVAPTRLEDLLFGILVAGYVPVLTHPERLGWIKSHYAMLKRSVEAGTWIQVTAGSVTGAFGRTAQYWAERLLDEGCVHLLASDAHNVTRRPPNLSRARDAVARRINESEAEQLVVGRPKGVVQNEPVSELSAPLGAQSQESQSHHLAEHGGHPASGSHFNSSGRLHRLGGRLLRLFTSSGSVQ